MKIDLDYLILIAITATFGGLGILIGYYAHAAFYSQSAIIFALFAFLVIRDTRTQTIKPTQ